MMKMACLPVLFVAVISYSLPAQPIRIELQPNAITEINVDGTNALQLADLSWAWNSSVACFPETEAEHFTGYHVLYTFDLPTYTEVEIEAIPGDPSLDLSLYAYEVGQVSASNTVPNLNSCIRCEVDHKWDRPRRGRTQTHVRKVSNILALRNPYEVVVGIVGPKTAFTEAGVTLRIIQKNR